MSLDIQRQVSAFFFFFVVVSVFPFEPVPLLLYFLYLHFTVLVFLIVTTLYVHHQFNTSEQNVGASERSQKFCFSAFTDKQSKEIEGMAHLKSSALLRKMMVVH